jgi:uncharacterized RDD family membrane protein YckC
MSDDSPPADWQTRSLAFLIDLILYITLFYGLGATSRFWGVLLSMLYIVFRDGLFAGRSLGKKAMGIRVVHTDGRPISFVDSSFRNVPFLVSYLLPAALVIETIALLRAPERQRLGDRIAGTRVVREAEAHATA